MSTSEMETTLQSLNLKLKTSPGRDVKCDELITELKNEKVKFLTVVESMGDVLASTDKVVRGNGVEFLSEILTEIPKHLLSDREIVVIGNFYVERLQDHHSLLPAVVKGLLAIVKMQNTINETILKIMMQLFQHVNCRSQLSNDRHIIFSIIKEVVENHLNDVRLMGPDFVFGIISFADGETDPKNLLLLFTFLPAFLKNFPLGHLVEEMFEILSCYFPVDFNPISKNNISITREDLALNLTKCLSSVRDFAEFCLPLILEKLDSTLKVAKLDSYVLLQECCKTYGVDDFDKFLNPLWKMIQKDALPGSDGEICAVALKAIACLFEKLSSHVKNRDIFELFLSDVLTCVKSLLCKVNDSLFQPAINLLTAACTQSAVVTEEIFKHLQPFWQLKFTSTTPERKIILSALLPFIIIGQKFEIHSSKNADVLSSFQDLINLYLNSTEHDSPDVRKSAFIGIQRLIQNLDSHSRNILYSIVCKNIKSEEDPNVRKESVLVFRQLAIKYPFELSDIISQNLQVITNVEVGNLELRNILNALSVISEIPNFTASTIPLFLDIILKTHHCNLGFESLLNTVKSSSPEFSENILREYIIIDELITWWIEGVSKPTILEPYNDINMLHTTAELLELIMRVQQSEAQQSIVNKYVPIFMDKFKLYRESEIFSTNMLDTSSCTMRMVLLLEALIGSTRQDVKIPNVSVICDKLIPIAINSDDSLIRLSSSRLISTLANKLEESVAHELLDRISEEVLNVLNEKAKKLTEKNNAAHLYTWIVKGIVLRGSSRIQDLVMNWFDLLKRDDVGFTIAEGFRLVLEEEKVFLTLSSHCNVKILYRQRLFTYFSDLVKMYEASADEVKINYILALTRLVQGVPKQVFMSELPSVIAILLQSLNTNRTEILLASLQILLKLLEEKEKIFCDYIGSFVNKFLLLSKFEGCMKIRIGALRCLFYYGFYPTELLLPLKPKVIRELESCLDDKKRLVRSEAVNSRGRWFLVGAPGEDAIFS